MLDNYALGFQVEHIEKWSEEQGIAGQESGLDVSTGFTSR